MPVCGRWSLNQEFPALNAGTAKKGEKMANKTVVSLTDGSVLELTYAKFRNLSEDVKRKIYYVEIGEGVNTVSTRDFDELECLCVLILPKSLQTIKNPRYCPYLPKLVEIRNYSEISDLKYLVQEDTRKIATSEEDPTHVFTTEDGFVCYQDKEETILLLYIGNEPEITLPRRINGQKYRIDWYAFRGKNIRKLCITDGAKIIWDYAFSGCRDLKELSIEDGVLEIQNSVFRECTGLTNVVIPDSTTIVGCSAFAYCTNLTSVKIGKGLTEIDWLVFRGCSGLESITIPRGITKIGDNAFDECTSLAEIRYEGTIAEWNAIRKGYDWKNNVPEIKVVCTNGTVCVS